MSSDDLIYGVHAVASLLQLQSQRIKRLIILAERQHDQRIEELLVQAEEHSIPREFVSKKNLDELLIGVPHQGIIAVCHPVQAYAESDLYGILDKLTTPPFLLILDGIQDPHNLGACLRTADAAGVHAVIAPKDRAVALTPTVCKVASGAAESVPFIQVVNLARVLRTLRERDIWLFGLSERGTQSLYQTDLRGPVAFLLGAEEKGLRHLTESLCDGLLAIPMQGWVSSLNVSVATGICLFEAVRQRSC